MSNYSYVLSEKVVYDSSGGKLNDAINEFNKINEEGYKIVEDLKDHVNIKDPDVINKLDKAILYLKNLQSVYDRMDKFIDKYMEDEMKSTPEIAKSIKLDCELTKKNIEMMKEKDKELIKKYINQKSLLQSKNKDEVKTNNIINNIKAVFLLHKRQSPKIKKIYNKISA